MPGRSRRGCGTGELSDATSGTSTFFSRTYDPMAATWLSADSYRGTLTDPQSQHRYGYVGGNPVTMVDQFGFSARTVMDGSRRPPPPAASLHTADGWDRLIAGDPAARTPSDSGSNHIPARHESSGEGYSGWAQQFNAECASWEPCPLNRERSPWKYPAIWSSCGSFLFNGAWRQMRCVPTTPQENASELGGIAIDVAAILLLKRAQGLKGETAAGLTIVGEGFSASELAAARYLAAQGRTVVLREADPAAARMSDLLVDGLPYDVYSPTTTSINRIISETAKKGSQVRGGGVVIDLSGTSISAGDLGDVLKRVQGITSQISDVIIIGG